MYHFSRTYNKLPSLPILAKNNDFSSLKSSQFLCKVGVDESKFIRSQMLFLFRFWSLYTWCDQTLFSSCIIFNGCQLILLWNKLWGAQPSILNISTKSRPLILLSPTPSSEPNVVFLASSLLKLIYLSILSILQMTVCVTWKNK